jgi:hypothetical protein
MQHETMRGKILYLRKGQETGREWFTITRHGDGQRTLRAYCEMDDHELVRDVTYTVGRDWRPLDCFVRLTIHDKFVGSSWFRFADDVVECQGFTAAEGRIDQRYAVSSRPPSFGAHPIVCDMWHLSQFDRSGPRRQTLEGIFLSSPKPDGGSGPMLARKNLTIEYRGKERLAVPAGTFEADRFEFVLGAPHPANESLWCYGTDIVPLKVGYPIYESTYELAELSPHP